MRDENEKDTMAARQCTISMSIFLNEVTFIQSQIISFPFSLLAERKNLYREVKRGAVSLFAIFNLVCVEGNTRTIKIQTIWDRGDNPPALLSEVRGRHRRGVSRDYERKWCLNGSLSDLFSTLWWQRLIRGQYWKSLSQKWPNPVGGNVIMVLWCADLLSRGNGRGNQPGGQIWLRPVGQMTSVVSFQSKSLERWSRGFRKRPFVSMCIKNTVHMCTLLNNTRL